MFFLCSSITNIDLCAYYIPQYPREKSVASAAYQELKSSVLEMEKSKKLQEKKKIMAETEKIELEKRLLKLQIQKIERDSGDDDKYMQILLIFVCFC